MGQSLKSKKRIPIKVIQSVLLMTAVPFLNFCTPGGDTAEMMTGPWEYAVIETTFLERLLPRDTQTNGSPFKWLNWEPMPVNGLPPHVDGNLLILKTQLPPPSRNAKSILLQNVISLRSVWIDDRLIQVTGFPDRGLFRYTKEAQQIFELPEYEEGAGLYLIYQVRDEIPSAGFEPPVTGSALGLKYILTLKNQTYTAVGFLFLLVGAGSVLLYFLRRKEYAFLPFSVFTLVSGINLWMQTRQAILLFIDVDLLRFYIVLLTTFLSPIAFTFFFDSVITRGKSRIIQVVKVIYSFFGIIGFPFAIGGFIPFEMILQAFVATNLVVVLVFGSVSWISAQNEGSERKLPAIALTASFILYFAAIIHDTLAVSWQFADTDRYIPWALLILLIAITYSFENRLRIDSRRLRTVEVELESAEQIQSRILPSEMPSNNRLSVSVLYEPMIHVAGDFYDFQSKDKNTDIFIIADVSGHGAGAGIVAGISRFCFQLSIDKATGPADLLSLTNGFLYGRLSDQFVSGACIWFDYKQQTVRIAAAGHPPVLYQSAGSGTIQKYKPAGRVLGFFEHQEFEEIELKIQQNDRMIFYTDGITETINENRESFGFQRLDAFLQKHRFTDTDSLTKLLRSEIDAFKGAAPVTDDITMIAAEIKNLTDSSE